jgi:hypothetical protein
VVAQGGQFLPFAAAVDALVQRGVFAAGVDRVGVVAGRFEVPDPLELERAWSAVVPEVLTDLTLVGEVVADRVPRPAAVVGPLDDLAEPARGL